MDRNFINILALAVVFTVLFVNWLRSSKRCKSSLPPGPRKLPFIGNILSIPPENQWLAFSKLAKELGTDVFHLDIAGKSFVILESEEAVTELLDNRSAIYSSRPVTKVIHQLLGWSWATVLMPYGDLWRERRRMFDQYFHPSDTSLHRDHEINQLHIFLNNILKEPQELISHIRHMIGAITITMTYGIKVECSNDPHVRLAENTIKHLGEAGIFGTFLVEFMPFLKYFSEWLPCGRWKIKIRKYKQEMYDLLNKPYNAALENETPKDSFFSRYYGDLPGEMPTTDEEKTLKEMAAQIFFAGADTTVSALSTFFLAMVTYPEVFKKAQQEVDSISEGRLPVHDDMASMPYLQALLTEVMRWQPILPLGVFHSVLEDDIYKGYRIPKDSIILPNVWSLCHDPKEFPEPDLLKPDRFLENGKFNVPGRDPAKLNFGFGRRACPGSHIGISMWFICAATVLALFDISKARDEKGNIIEPNCQYNSRGAIRQAGPFICSIKPRSQEAIDIIQSLI